VKDPFVQSLFSVTLSCKSLPSHSHALHYCDDTDLGIESRSSGVM
jgi:hypothetical protein